MPQLTLDQAFQLAVQHHQANRLAEAERLYRQILQHAPDNSFALGLMGILHGQSGRHADAIAMLRRAISLAPAAPTARPHLAQCYGHLGQCLLATGQLDQAAEAFRQAIAFEPNDHEIHVNLGSIHANLGQHQQAIACYQQAIRVKENYYAAHANLGACYVMLEKYAEALPHIRRAIALNPNGPDAHTNLGLILEHSGQLDEAIHCHQTAIKLDPRHAIAHNNLGIAFRAAGRLDEAIRSHQAAISLDPRSAAAHASLGNVLCDAGRLDEAIQSHRRAIQLDPRSAEAHFSLGIVFQRAMRMDDAEAAYRRAIELRPDYQEAINNLGDALQQKLRLEDAEACFRKAIELRPSDPEPHNNLGTVLVFQWQIEESLSYARKALALRPDHALHHSNLLLHLHYLADCDRQALFAEHRLWAQQHAALPMQSIRPHANSRDPNRRLRIGYLSPDFRQHAVSYFIEPILANHDRAAFEVFCYSNVICPDAATRRLRRLTDGWRDVIGRPDQQVVEMIRSDAIDILVDLSGHTANNRLLILAYKPAPVQMTYLGYPDTTGLPTIDYRITDAIADPPGMTESFHTEQLLRLDGCFLCYRPREDAPEVAQPPAARSGHVTFGCFCNIAKITVEMLRLWAKLLQAVPGSHLLLKDKGLMSTKARASILAALSGEGIEAERVELLKPEPAHPKHLELYGRMDLALDTFPYCGTTTTCEALWMGVPVVSLAGEAHVSRVGCSLLNAVGLPQLVASTPDQYIHIAVDLAGDADKLASLRAGLRQRMQQSPLVDAPAFTRRLEAAYRQAWAQWCSAATP